MPRQPGDKSTDMPSAPGWYPDPWSATGEGERYFDGKRWGTNERPLARYTESPFDERPVRKRVGFRRALGPLAVLVVIVLAAYALPKLGHKSKSRPASLPATSATDQPPPSKEEQPHPIGTPAAVPAGNGQFEIEQHQPNDNNAPVAWDPCRPVHYVVNLAAAPSDALNLIEVAVAHVQSATGLHFVRDGTTNEVPNKERADYQPTRYSKDRWAPVLIAWSDDKAYPELAGYIAGLTSPDPVYAQPDRLVYVSGEIVLDSNQLSTSATPDRGIVQAIIMHELGHLVGLDHTSDKRQIMYSESQFNVRDYAQGDLRGLALLGTQPCYPNI